MTNMTKNYYKILGISENSTEQEIKSAYRKLAIKWHPDIAGNTSEVVSRFKDINEAYEILSDEKKRADYDTVNRYYNYSSTNTNNNESYTTNPDLKKKEKKTTTENTKSSGFNFNWEDFIEKYKEYTKKYNEGSSTKKTTEQKEKYGTPQKGNDINTDVEITIAEAVNGATKIINMISTYECPHCKGRKFINGSICKHCNGTGEKSEYRRFTVKIPSGIKDNSKIRLSGEGENGFNGGKNGDLYITVHIKKSVDYTTEGNNILKHITLAPYEAVLGGNITVKTFDGDNINVKISPNTQNGQKIRLNGCGINAKGKVGDMILIVDIQIQPNLSEKELELYRKLRDISNQTIR